MRPVPLIDLVKDLGVEPDVVVVMLLAREPICSNADLAWAVDRNEQGLSLIAHGLEVPRNAARERRSAVQVTDVGLGYLVVGLDEHHSVVEVFQAGLDRQLDSRELSSIAAHALLRRLPKALCLVLELARVTKWCALAALTEA